MSILVVGSVAFDSIVTPFGKADRAIGGSATYFSIAASFFTPVNLVAVVGDDFGEAEMRVFDGRPIDTTGLLRADGKTFFWSGEYGFDLNSAQTKETKLNVFADFKPDLPQQYRSPDVLFLANIDPELQLEVLQQVARPRLTALDTMNYWISSKKDALERIIREVDLLLINEGELRQFTNEVNLVKAARRILDMGPQTVVLKRGEYGVIMFTRDRVFALPAYPLEAVFDPTGAGDTFAGGFLGYLGSRDEISELELRRAIVFGSVVASFNVEAFSMNRLLEIGKPELFDRFREFKMLTHFETMELGE